MSDSPLDKVPAHNRVSIRAVLVHEGEDASAALAEAGFAETITVPVVVGEQPDLPSGILGNGTTPNVTAVLDTEQEGGAEALAHARQRSTRPPEADAHPKRSDTTTLPAAYGMQPLAPVRRTGDFRKHSDVAAET
ncbi:hypothetical protein [Acidisphaera sp. S103]|uniref:hypothetical protein n=1 Tax=Acidisphaera sp. S103 TaxID=1747223 RepID=UPI00131E3902|nr:hypothetical protein [Acidisphaera sp. S103]